MDVAICNRYYNEDFWKNKRKTWFLNLYPEAGAGMLPAPKYSGSNCKFEPAAETSLEAYLPGF